MVEVPIQFPFGGLSDNLAFTDQEQGTTRDARNMRGIDPVTGRIRGAQRSGLSRFVDAQVSGTNFVNDITSVVFDNKLVTYAANSSTPGDGNEVVAWAKTTPTLTDSKGGVVDRAGNVYALDGKAGLVKFNADGVQQWKFSFPVANLEHEIRALRIDAFDNIYVGVSAGGIIFDEEEEVPLGRIWRYRQPILETEAEIVLEWELQIDAYCEDVVVRDGLLYTGQNRPAENASEIVVYRDIDTANPQLHIRGPAPHPINAIAVGPDGSTFVASDENGERGIHPTDPDSDPVLIDWTPDDLTDAKKRIWSWYSARDLQKSLEDGDDVKLWKDRTGQGRAFRDHVGNVAFDEVDDGNGGGQVKIRRPKFKRFAQAGLPGVRFNGKNRGLKTAENTGTSAKHKSNQTSAVPMYENSAYALFIVARIANDADDRKYCLLSQERELATVFASTDRRAVVANRLSATNYPGGAGAFEEWTVSFYDDATNAHGASGTQPATDDGTFDSAGDFPSNNPNGIVILSIIVDGANGGADDDDTQSVWRLNGRTFDRYRGKANNGEAATDLGYDRREMHISADAGSGGTAGNLDFFRGEILEILVLDKQDDSGDADSILTHPFVYDATDVNVVPPFQAYAGSADDTTGYSEMEQIEGYLAWAWGAASVLVAQGAGPSAHTFDLSGGPPSKETGQDDSLLLQQLEGQAVVTKYDQNLKPVWKLGASDTTTTGNEGGVGYGVAVDSVGNVYCAGPSQFGAGDNVTIRKIVDNGTSLSTDAADGAWDLEITRGGDTFDLNYKQLRMVTDEFDNVYVPLYDTDVGASNRLSLMVLAKDADPINTNAPDILNEYVLSADQQVHAVALESQAPDYGSAINLHRHVYLFSTNESNTANATVHKVELVGASIATGSVRTITNLAVSNGNIKKFTTSTVTTPTGGSGALSASAQSVFSAVMFGKVFYTDGLSYKVYDPKDDEVESFLAQKNGTIPPLCSLIATWRGRLVLARSSDQEDGGHFWAMSAIGNAFDWDFFPKVQSSSQAVAGTVAVTGRPIDIINTLVPYNDDLLLFGCDHHIFRLSGDPADGGQVDLVSDVTGMAFGEPWAKSPEGVLFFAGANGSIYAMDPYSSSAVTRISRQAIERRLQDKDLEDYRFKLVWNQRDEGLHVFLVPLAGSGGTVVDHYFWEQKTGSWWEDRFGDSDVQPTSAFVLDGDEEGDRVLVLGCEDGRIRKWDESAETDDSNNIDSYVTFGPLSPRGVGQNDPLREYRWSHFQATLASDQGGCIYELFGFKEPDPHSRESSGIVDDLGTPLVAGNLFAGFNPKVMERVRARHAYVRMRNATGSRWSLESASIGVAAAGRIR